MNFFINSPSYYTMKYGVVDEVYCLCNAFSKSINVSDYTDAVDTIAITPIIAPIHVYEQDLFKEHKIVRPKTRMADISLRSDYEAFAKASVEYKQKIIIDNILRSLTVVKQKLKEKFDYNGFVSKVLSIAKTFVVY